MQFFLRGTCKEGSACKFINEKDNEAPMRQAISSKDSDGEQPMRQSSRRHETESAYWQEENETREWVLDIEKKYNRSLSQICDGIVAGYKRELMEKELRHGQDDLQEQRQRENTEWQRYFEKERREAQEHAHEQRLMEIPKKSQGR